MPWQSTVGLGWGHGVTFATSCSNFAVFAYIFFVSVITVSVSLAFLSLLRQFGKYFRCIGCQSLSQSARNLSTPIDVWALARVSLSLSRTNSMTSAFLVCLFYSQSRNFSQISRASTFVQVTAVLIISSDDFIFRFVEAVCFLWWETGPMSS